MGNKRQHDEQSKDLIIIMLRSVPLYRHTIKIMLGRKSHNILFKCVTPNSYLV